MFSENSGFYQSGNCTAEFVLCVCITLLGFLEGLSTKSSPQPADLYPLCLYSPMRKFYYKLCFYEVITDVDMQTIQTT